ncbi:hypothetical protein [Streptomyces sp. WELS2]|uniref:hypothetical protein n=1 Tax=Streptomyces sp. WELS2 TaxID=2749435 RepID=UPI0015F0972B|nr:hypothetical protein [Streptomyces sp. WELS2]
MQMNSLPQHLKSEDLREFERLLDEVLRSVPHRPEPAAAGRRLTTGQLRAMALDASALIAAAAAAEYRHYAELRDTLRHPALTAPAATGDSTATATAPDTGTTPDEAAEDTGAGAAAVLAVLAPVLSGTAAAIFLLVGYVLRALSSEQVLARTLLATGWVFAALTAATALVAAVGLLLAALRNRTPAGSRARDRADEEALDRAREAWRAALLERGILPFLEEALAKAGPAGAQHPLPSAPTGRIPRLGYDRPGFSSPGDGTAPGRPRFSGPDYTSPDFGGPEHRPE